MYECVHHYFVFHFLLPSGAHCPHCVIWQKTSHSTLWLVKHPTHWSVTGFQMNKHKQTSRTCLKTCLFLPTVRQNCFLKIFEVRNTACSCRFLLHFSSTLPSLKIKVTINHMRQKTSAALISKCWNFKACCTQSVMLRRVFSAALKGKTPSVTSLMGCVQKCNVNMKVSVPREMRSTRFSACAGSLFRCWIARLRG